MDGFGTNQHSGNQAGSHVFFYTLNCRPMLMPYPLKMVLQYARPE
jgi:hypothetical protein